MKYIGDKEADGVLDRLLKVEIGRASRTGTPCSQYDPDLSAAYVERNLTPGETIRYEVHLASCSSCRIQVATLARAGYQAALDRAGVETALSPSAPQVILETPFSLSRVWAYLLQPQWIAIGTAALILLIAVPVFVILKSVKRQPAGTAVAISPASGDAEAILRGRSTSSGTPGAAVANPSAGSPQDERRVNPPAEEDVDLRPKDGNADRVATAVPASASGSAASDRQATSQKDEAENRKAEAEKASGMTQIAQNSPPQNQNQQKDIQQSNGEQVKVTAENATIVQDQAKQEAGVQPATAPSQEHAGKRADLYASSQISSKEAQTLPDDKDKKGPEVTIIRQGGGTNPDGSRSKGGTQTIRPNDAQPPKTEATRDEPDRRAIASRPTRELANKRSDADSVRKQPLTSPSLARGQKFERRVENKKFRLQAGVWTDRDFKPSKEIPAVTLIRDSELYKAALARQPGLKALMAGFESDERVILVYKSIIYKIFPPKD
jgi:hypothetical protein